MRRSFLALTLAVLVVVCSSVTADTLLLERFRDYVESLRVQAGIPGLSVAIVGGNEKLWEWPFGQRDVERSMAMTTGTPFHLDALTQIFTAAVLLRCTEEGRLSLDDRIGKFKDDSPDPNATIRQLLTHTSGSPDSLAFAYRPDRLAPLTAAVRACTGDSYRETLANLFERLAI